MQVGDYVVHFRVSKERLPLSHKEVPSIMAVIHTGACTNVSVPCNTPNSAYAFAQTSPKDVHRPLVGRKIAIQRALKTLGLTKQQRTTFWAAYYKKVSIPKSHHKKA